VRARLCGLFVFLRGLFSLKAENMQLSKIVLNPRVLLYGYGLEGKSSEAWCQAYLNPKSITVYEDKNNERPDWDRFDLIVKSPGVPPSAIPEAVWPKVTSNLRLFLENLSEANRAKVIGITGSKGKSTTAKFTHQLLKTAGFKSTIIGNFGVPALEVWNEVETLDYLVAECSSFQLYDLETSPKYSLFLSFFADHLDWHNASEVDYFAAKENLWAHQKEGDELFFPNNLPVNVALALTHGAAQNRLTPAVVTKPVSTDLFPANSNLQALHFRQNLGTVWALAQRLEIPDLEKKWQQAALDFEPIEHRLEAFCERAGFSFINDSIATSPDATQAGVNWLGKNLSALILDGADTGVGDFNDLVETLIKQSPEALILLVESDITHKFLAAPNSKVLNCKTVESYERAIDTLLVAAKPGVVLFSPAGKSFNRFKNYAERGTFFKKIILNLPS